MKIYEKSPKVFWFIKNKITYLYGCVIKISTYFFEALMWWIRYVNFEVICPQTSEIDSDIWVRSETQNRHIILFKSHGGEHLFFGSRKPRNSYRTYKSGWKKGISKNQTLWRYHSTFDFQFWPVIFFCSKQQQHPDISIDWKYHIISRIWMGF